MAGFSIDIWSDVACPWCYIGKRRLEAALPQVPGLGEVEITWHAFELDPSAPRENNSGTSYAERLAKKYGQTTDQAERMIARVVEVARAEGLDFRFDRIRPGNTFDAHRLLAHARLAGRQDAVAERLFHAYFTEGKCIARAGELQSVAVAAGLDADVVSNLLSSDLLTEEVRQDQSEAAALGVHAVPFFVFDQRLAVSGAQGTTVFVQALERALRERAPSEFEEGAVCGPAGC
ncbi:MAG TPA: DsbA family oxidoreductase [Polyangiaceae bacterium]|nr:DsbA family oxidoreductase [Polyangiaceae bacterium]